MAAITYDYVILDHRDNDKTVSINRWHKCNTFTCAISMPENKPQGTITIGSDDMNFGTIDFTDYTDYIFTSQRPCSYVNIMVSNLPEGASVTVIPSMDEAYNRGLQHTEISYFRNNLDENS